MLEGPAWPGSISPAQVAWIWKRITNGRRLTDDDYTGLTSSNTEDTEYRCRWMNLPP